MFEGVDKVGVSKTSEVNRHREVSKLISNIFFRGSNISDQREEKFHWEKIEKLDEYGDEVLIMSD